MTARELSHRAKPRTAADGKSKRIVRLEADFVKPVPPFADPDLVAAHSAATTPGSSRSQRHPTQTTVSTSSSALRPARRSGQGVSLVVGQDQSSLGPTTYCHAHLHRCTSRTRLGPPKVPTHTIYFLRNFRPGETGRVRQTGLPTQARTSAPSSQWSLRRLWAKASPRTISGLIGLASRGCIGRYGHEADRGHSRSGSA